MTMAPFDLSAVVIAVISTVNVLITANLSRKQKEHSEKLDVINDQVSNDHGNSATPNLRIDLDKKFLAVNSRMDALSAKVGIIQDDMLRIEKDLYNSIGEKHGNSH